MEVAAIYGDDVVFVGVPGLGDADSVDRFVNETGVGTIRHLAEPTTPIWDRFGVTQHRTYVIIDDDGTWNTEGYGRLEAAVQDLIER